MIYGYIVEVIILLRWLYC